MKSLVLVLAVMLASPGWAADTGVVESVREVPMTRDIHAFEPDVLVHKVHPAEELVIRLDGGSVISVIVGDDAQRLQRGQRVRVTLTNAGPLIEPHYGVEH